ncbi:hypothetical protein [Microbulbifer thermotolerans]|uniref:hypothetical protein n=1 Tax=Microbulbifer thermotolerans TaxID=252514 RepID=UPI0011142487|nr:hypothetical protein [Microbulbifer thermotolerans]
MLNILIGDKGVFRFSCLLFISVLFQSASCFASEYYDISLQKLESMVKNNFYFSLYRQNAKQKQLCEGIISGIRSLADDKVEGEVGYLYPVYASDSKKSPEIKKFSSHLQDDPFSLYTSLYPGLVGESNFLVFQHDFDEHLENGIETIFFSGEISREYRDSKYNEPGDIYKVYGSSGIKRNYVAFVYGVSGENDIRSVLVKYRNSVYVVGYNKRGLSGGRGIEGGKFIAEFNIFELKDNYPEAIRVCKYVVLKNKSEKISEFKLNMEIDQLREPERLLSDTSVIEPVEFISKYSKIKVDKITAYDEVPEEVCRRYDLAVREGRAQTILPDHISQEKWSQEMLKYYSKISREPYENEMSLIADGQIIPRWDPYSVFLGGPVEQYGFALGDYTVYQTDMDGQGDNEIVFMARDLAMYGYGDKGGLEFKVYGANGEFIDSVSVSDWKYTEDYKGWPGIAKVGKETYVYRYSIENINGRKNLYIETYQLLDGEFSAICFIKSRDFE